MIEKMIEEIPRDMVREMFDRHQRKINELIEAVSWLSYCNSKRSSSSIEKTIDLTFEEAMKFFRGGKKIRRAAWDNRDYFLHKECYSDNFLANDWMVVDD